MTGYYIIEPEVAGGWGENTDFTRTPGRPVVVHKLHYEFDGWLGDPILETTPCYIVSEQLAEEISREGLTGVSFDDVEVTKSDQFRELYPDRVLPKFLWLKVEGAPGRDDFGVTDKLELVISTRTLNLLEKSGVSNALVELSEGCSAS